MRGSLANKTDRTQKGDPMPDQNLTPPAPDLKNGLAVRREERTTAAGERGEEAVKDRGSFLGFAKRVARRPEKTLAPATTCGAPP